MRELINGDQPVCCGPDNANVTQLTKRHLPQCSALPSQRPRLEDNLWKHAGLMKEFGGVKQFLKMKRGDIPWPQTQPTTR